jgi:hypothetical protein
LISTLPEAVAVTVTEQLPDDSVQIVEEKETFPVPETFDQVTVPVCDGYPPDTVAVQVTEVLLLNDVPVHDKARIVGAFAIVNLV